jgi:hypothetical protein
MLVHLALGTCVFATLTPALLSSAVIDPKGAGAVEEAPEVSLRKVMMKLRNGRQFLRGPANQMRAHNTIDSGQIPCYFLTR